VRCPALDPAVGWSWHKPCAILLFLESSAPPDTHVCLQEHLFEQLNQLLSRGLAEPEGKEQLATVRLLACKVRAARAACWRLCARLPVLAATAARRSAVQSCGRPPLFWGSSSLCCRLSLSSLLPCVYNP
jgi:hypothetical protein